MSTNKYYLVRYCLTKGIEEVESDNTSVYGGHTHVYVKSFYGAFRLGKDIFLDKNQAVIAANEIKGAKIASLKKQIAKLEKAEFK